MMEQIKQNINERIKKEKEIRILNKIKAYDYLKKESIKIIEKDPILEEFIDNMKIYIKENITPEFMNIVEETLKYKYCLNNENLIPYFDKLFKVSGVSWWNYYIGSKSVWTLFKLNVDKPFETTTHYVLFYLIILLLESINFELKDIKHFNCVVRKQYKSMWSWKCKYILYFCFYLDERSIFYDYYFPL
jgi:hypothetical protein